MPKVGLYQERNRIESRAPSALENPRAARRQGEDISNFGDQVVRTGANLETFFKARKEAKDRITLDGIRLQAVEQAQNLDRTARTQHADNPDGMVDFYDTQFQKNTDTLYKDLEPGAAAQAQNIVQQVRLQTRDGLNNYALKRSVEVIQEDSEALVNQTTSLVYQNPKMFDEQRLELLTGLETLRKAGVYDEVAYRQQVKGIEQKLVMATVSGLSSQKKFNEAREEVKRLGAYIGAESSQKLDMMVAQQQLTHNQQQLQLEAQEERKAEKRIELMGKSNGQQLLQSVIEAKSPEDREQVLEMVAQMEARGQPVDKYFKGAINTLVTRTQSIDDNEFTLDIMTDMTSSGVKMSVVRKKLLQGISDGKISDSSAVKLLRSINQKAQVKKAADPLDEKLFNAKLDKYYNKTGVTYNMNARLILAPRVQLQEASYKIHKERGIPLSQAIDIAYVNSASSNLSIIPYAPFVDPALQDKDTNIGAATKLLDERFNKKQITESEYLNSLELLDARKKAIIQDKELKEIRKGARNAEGQ